MILRGTDRVQQDTSGSGGFGQAGPEAQNAGTAVEASGLRVLQVMSGAAVGGIETFFFDAVEALHAAGLAQFVVCRPNVPHRLEKLRALGISFASASFSKWWPWSTRTVLADARTAFKPNLAQFWTGRAAQFAVRGKGYLNIGWFGGYRQMKDFTACDDFIGITPDLMRHLQDGGADPARTVRIHTFAALPELAPVPVSRASLATPDDAPLLLILARLHPKKGVDTLLNALAKVPGAFLWIAGEGEDRPAFELLAKSLGIEERVRFLGWRNDRAELLAAADVCVMPSRFEPFGTVMAEAWSAGTPLITAAAQGPLAYVKDGINGLMVPIDDPLALAAAVRRVISDPALAASLVAGGHRTYDESFTRTAYVRQTLTFYRTVLNRVPDTEDGR